MKDHVIAGHKNKDRRAKDDTEDEEGPQKNDEDDNSDEIQCEQDIPLIKL